jgi:hypothetical protein
MALVEIEPVFLPGQKLRSGDGMFASTDGR